MSAAADIVEPMTERHARRLAAFAERAAQLADDLADRALAAEGAAEAADLARAFHAVGRSLRQAIALEQRLERAAVSARREDADAAGQAERQAVTARKAQQRQALRRRAWTEVEAMDFDLPDDCEFDRRQAAEISYLDFTLRIDEAVDDAARDAEAFLAEPLQLQLERLTALSLRDEEAETEDQPLTALADSS